MKYIRNALMIGIGKYKYFGIQSGKKNLHGRCSVKISGMDTLLLSYVCLLLPLVIFNMSPAAKLKCSSHVTLIFLQFPCLL